MWISKIPSSCNTCSKSGNCELQKDFEDLLKKHDLKQVMICVHNQCSDHKYDKRKSEVAHTC